MIFSTRFIIAALGLLSPVLAERQQIVFAEEPSLVPSSLSHLVPSLESLYSIEIPGVGYFNDELRGQLEAHINSYPEERFVVVGESTDAVRITEGQKGLLNLLGLDFVDVTRDVLEPLVLPQRAASEFPSNLTYSKPQLEPYFQQLHKGMAKGFLYAFTKFRNRYYRAESGVQSEQFLLKTINKAIKKAKGVNVTVTEFAHDFPQNSIIVRIEPEDEAAKAEAPFIIGAHQDSINMLPFLPAPGADDDGSGTTSLLASFFVLMNNSYVPSLRPIEYHFYAAEEGGLLGSKDVAREYATLGTPVYAMHQIDMTAFVKEGTEPTIALVTDDFVDKAFTDFVRIVATEYSNVKAVVDTSCGYACSDHASWLGIGVPSSFSIEGPFKDTSPFVHSVNDFIDKTPEFSFEHILEFTRLALGLTIEIGGGDSLKL